MIPVPDTCSRLLRLARLAALFIVILAGVAEAPRVFADGVDPHFQSDSFAAEAAALAPAFRPVLAATPTPGERITLGDWTARIVWTPHIPVSAATLPDGRLLTFASNQRTTFPAGPEFTYAATWNPSTGAFVEYNHTNHDMFCGALVMLPDGRVLVNGGRATTVRSSIFDWRVNTWTRTPDMNDPRWYNTSVALPSGEVWTASGSGGSTTAERWSSAVGWSRLTGIDWTPIINEPGYITIWHPFMTLAPDGRLFHFGPTDTMHWVVPEGAGQVSDAGTVVPGTHYPKEGSWVMYDEGKVVVAGGGANTAANPSDSTTGTSSPLAYTVDLNGVNPVVTPTASMSFARQFANCVVLPNGEVMVMGGNTSGLKFNDTGSVLTPEIWNPSTGRWRTVADMSVPRNYHSLALLLPDGRVLSGGGGLGGNSADHQDVQIYTPPNLFNPDGTLVTRPSLNTAPSVVGVGTQFAVTGTPGITTFSFIKMSAITHSVNTDLRRLVLPSVETSAGNYMVTARPNLNVMTPGYWMLFGLNAAGVHSVAKIIRVDSTAAVQVAAPGSQASYVNQTASLQMNATGPAGAVLTWSATGLPSGMTIAPATGRISGTPTATGTSTVRVTVTDGLTLASTTFSWVVQPQSYSQTFSSFPNATGLTVNGNATVTAGVLRLTPNALNQAGSVYLASPIALGPNTSFTTRWVFRTYGTADGADGMAFVIQGVSGTSVGSLGGGLGYGGLAKSVAVEIDNYQGAGDPNGNHVGVVSGGNTTVHLATWNATWDLENEQAHTVWVDYDGTSNQMRVYVAQGDVAQRPGTAQVTATVDLPAVVGATGWFGFSASTGGAGNNQEIQAWNLSVNALALPAQPVITVPATQTSVAGVSTSLQMQGSDPNGDLLTWSATGLPTGLSIAPSSGLISGTPTVAGSFTPVVTVQDGNTLPVSRSFSWVVNAALTVQPLAGAAVPAGSTVALNVQSVGGLNPQYKWSFGDGTADTAFSASSTTSHTFANPGRYVVTATVRDATGRELTASYRQAVHAALTAAKPNRSSSLLYETRPAANARLWVVNPDNDSVTIFDAVTRAKLSEVAVGLSPRTIALAPDARVWVVNYNSATISILDAAGVVVQTVTLPRGSRPFAVVFDPAGTSAFVSLEGAGKVLKLNPTTGVTVATLDLGAHVRHLSVTADGARLLVSRFISPRVPGEEGAAPQTTVASVKYGGEVIVVNAGAFTVNKTVVLEHSEQPDTSNSAKGIPNYLGAAVISPDGLTAWVPSKQDNIKRGTLRNGGVLTHDMSIRSIASRVVLSTLLEDTASRVDYDNAGIASAAAFDGQGVFLYTALEGSREVAVTDVWAKQEVLRFEAGRAPQGLVVSPDGKTLFVHNFMDRSVTVHDLTKLVNGGETPPPAPVVLGCVTTEKLEANVLLGKKHFYDARDTRLAFQQYISCASCHNDGGQDGRVWDFTQFGEGVRNTITLRGHGGVAQGPLHWTGNFDEVQDFEGQIRAFAAGSGLMADADFHAGTRSQSLGDTKAGISADLDALAAYVGSLKTQGDSPNRNADGTMTAAGLAGRTLFAQLNCASCHSGAGLTDSALGVFHNVGTQKPASGGRLGGALTGFDTPTLLGLWNTGPYLHDGSALTLEDAIAAHSGVTTTVGDRSNLAAFLRQLDDAGLGSASAGLKAQYFTGRTFSPLVLERTDTTINFDWATGSPGAGVPVDNFSVRWTGRVEPLYSEAYTFYARTDDGVRLWINNQLVIDNWIDQAPAELATAAIPLKAGTKYDVKMEYYENGGGAVAQLSWSSASQAKQIIPANRLYAPLAVTPVITWATPAAIVYGAALSGAQLNAVADVAGTFSYDPPLGTVLGAGAGKVLTATFVPTDLNTYVPVSRTVLLTVGKAPLVVKADDKSRAKGLSNPTLTATYTGFVNGEGPGNLLLAPTLSTTATAASAQGSYPITASGAGSANYAITYTAGTLTVTAPLVVSLAVGPSTPSVNVGQTVPLNAQATLTDGSIQAVTGLATWVSQNAGIATVNASGVVTGVSAGNSLITATYQGQSAGVTVTVNASGPVTQRFDNLAPITILDATAASPYPASIVVSGVSGPLLKATVTVTGLSHTYPGDVDMLLVAPNGQTVMLMSDAGQSGVLNGVNLVFDDGAAGLMSETSLITAGSYKPTNYGSAVDSFAAPAPAGPYGSTLGSLAGINANGTWALYITDDAGVDVGSISGGWSLSLTSGFNAAPTISNLPDVTVNEDTATAAIPFTVGDTDSPVVNLVVAVTSSNPAVVGATGLELGGTGSSRTLRVTPVLNASGTSTLTVTVSDGQATASDTLLVTVVSVNDVPTITGLANIVLPSGTASGVIPFVVGDVETAAGSLTVNATSSNTALVNAGSIVLGGSGANRTLQISPVASVLGSATITVSATDANGGTGSQLFVVTVQSQPVPVVYSNPTSATLVDLAPASVYPSTINVSGFAGVTAQVKVSLIGLNHTYPADMDVLLVSPTGEKIMLMSDAGGSSDLIGTTLTFDDSAAQLVSLPGPIVSGTYRPTNYAADETMPVPAPPGPYDVAFTGLVGKSPIGIWSLYIADDEGIDSGTWTGGWTLTLTPAVLAPASLGSGQAASVALAEAAGGMQLSVGRAVEVGHVPLTVTGATGAGFVVEYSSDLVEWHLLAEGVASTQGAEVIDATHLEVSQRFYRVRSKGTGE